MALALFTVSWYSSDGTLSATTPPPAWLDTLTVDGYVEGGAAMNFNQPWNNINWGHLYTIDANQLTFNGAVLTAMRPIDPKSDNYDFGFKAQIQIGEDMRFNHVIGTTDYWIPSRTQIGPLEANVQAHLPWKSFISEGGVDVKAGIFPTYNGAEVMYAKDNLFYSHSYIFTDGNFHQYFHLHPYPYSNSHIYSFTHLNPNPVTHSFEYTHTLRNSHGGKPFTTNTNDRSAAPSDQCASYHLKQYHMVGRFSLRDYR